MITLERATAKQLHNMVITYGIHRASFGWCVIGITDGKICQLTFLKSNSNKEAVRQLHALWPSAKLIRNNSATAVYITNVSKAEGPKGQIRVLVQGTDFQIAVWKQLLKIPRGKTITYAELATAIHSPKAARAVGSACGKNPIPAIVPCHRVLASNGGLGGYSGGLARKKLLLATERS